MLVQNPLAGRERPDLGPNLRSFAVHNYIVFYISQSAGIEMSCTAGKISAPST
jgi:toxin ParE1/3/4